MALLSGLPMEVAPSEVVVRHLFDRSHIEDAESGQPCRPAAQAFYPVPGTTVFSVVRKLGFHSQDDLERNGVEIGGKPRELGKDGRILRGNSELPVARIIHVPVLLREKELRKLNVVADEPPLFHAHVEGFEPLPSGAKRKEFYKQIGEDIRSIAGDVHLRTIAMEVWEAELENDRGRQRRS